LTGALLRAWNRTGLPFRLSTAAAVGILVAVAAAFILSLRFASDSAQQEIDTCLQDHLAALSAAIGPVYATQGAEAAHRLLIDFGRHAEIKGVRFQGIHGVIEGSIARLSAPEAPAWFARWSGIVDRSGSLAVVSGVQPVGTLFMDIDAAPVVDRVWERVRQEVLVASVALAVTMLGVWLIFRDAHGRLKVLIAGGLDLGEGRFSRRIPVGGGAEFTAAYAAFNTVAENLERLLAEVRLREANLNVTLRSIGDAVLVTDAEGRVTLMNPVAEALTGWPERDARRQPVETVFHIINQDTRQRVQSPVEIVLREGKVVGLANHTVLVARDGVERPIADSGAPIRAHPDSSVDGVVLVFRDQSEEYRMTRALKESEELYSSLVRSSPVGIFRLDHRGDIVYFNDVLKTLAGVDAGAGIEHWHSAVHRDDLEHFVTGLRNARREGREFMDAVRYAHSAQGELWVQLHLVPLFDAGGRVGGFVGTATDITAERRYRRRIEDLSALYATLSRVNSAIARCPDEQTLCEEICRVAVERGGFAAAWIAFAEHGGVRLAGFFGSARREIQAAVATMRLDVLPADRPTLVVRALTSGQVQVSNDIQNDPEVAPEWREGCRQSGIAAYTVVPVLCFGRIVSSIAFSSRKPGYFTAEILSLVEEIGRDFSFALENLERERQRKDTADQLALNEMRLRLALGVTGIGLKEVNLRTRRVWLDAMAAKILGIGEQTVEMEMADYLPLAYPEVDPQEIERLGDDMEEGRQQGYAYERPFKRPDGALRWLRTRGGAAVTSAFHGSDPVALSVMVDVTEQHEQAEREQLAMAMFTSSSEAILITDAEARIVMANAAFREQTGFAPEEVIGANPRILQSGRHDADFYRGLWSDLQRDGHWQGEIWNRRKDGGIYPALVNISAVRDGTGRVSHYVGQSNDISQQKEFENRITYLAYRDSLTGLPNRALLRDRVDQGLAQAQRENESLALLFVDLDHFKTINDSLGHAVGDLLLGEVAVRLNVAIRDMDTVGRLGGDEFLIMLPGADAEAAAHVAQKLLDAVSRPFRIADRDLAVTPSIGIAMYPRDGTSFDDLLKTADTAMYKAKAEGRNLFRFFTPAMNQAVLQRLTLESSLRRAIEAGEFVLFYQPQYDIRSGALVGAEALIRWKEPTLGFVSPGQFIPVAEETGLIEPIGTWVLDEACRQVRAWQDAGLRLPRVSVNVSARQFSAKGMVDTVERVLARYALPGEALEVELTESLLAGDMEHTLGVLRALRGRNVHAAVDDFGTGYSSLSYLKRFPINRLKIDQSFVRDIEQDADDKAIATAVVTLGHSLGMAVIAEGVETATQLEILRQMGCDEVQGYHLGRPMPADAFTALLRAA